MFTWVKVVIILTAVYQLVHTVLMIYIISIVKSNEVAVWRLRSKIDALKVADDNCFNFLMELNKH